MKKIDLKKMLNEVTIPNFDIKKALGVAFDEIREIETETLTYGCKGKYYMASNPETKKIALAKWNELSLRDIRLAKESWEAKEAFEDAPPRSETKKIALAKWNELSLIEVEKSETFEEMREVHKDVPPKSEAEEKSFKKWLSLVNNAQDCEEIWEYTRCQKHSKMVIRRAAEFYTI